MSAPHTLRRDPLTGDLVVLAHARSAMPTSPALRAFAAPAADDPARCPFCPGHEAETEKATQELLGADGRWLARSVLNRYPLIEPCEPHSHPHSHPHPHPHPHQGPHQGPHARGASRERPAVGVHEVLVESPAHGSDFADFSLEEALLAVALYRNRVGALGDHPGVRSVLLFRNRGARAGSSQTHPHAQCVGLPVVPPRVAARDARARGYFRRRGVPILRALLDEALDDGARVLEAEGAFCAVVPWAPHRPYESWIALRDVDGASVPFADLANGLLPALAATLLRAVRRVRAVTRGAAYNLVLRQPARAHAWAPWARWHLEVLPRMGGDAGFELASGVDAVSLDPVTAAERLRAVPEGVE